MKIQQAYLILLWKRNYMIKNLLIWNNMKACQFKITRKNNFCNGLKAFGCKNLQLGVFNLLLLIKYWLHVWNINFTYLLSRIKVILPQKRQSHLKPYQRHQFSKVLMLILYQKILESHGILNRLINLDLKKWA